MEKTFDARDRRAGDQRPLGSRGRLPRRRQRQARRRALLHPAAAAERHRQPAHGPRLQPHADGHPRPLAPDAGLRRALAARPRPRRHRHADGRRARARPRGNAGRREMGRDAFVAKVWEWKAQSGGTILEQSRRLGDSLRPVAQRLHHVRRPRRAGRRGGQLPRRGAEGLRRLLRARPDLPRQAPGQLGPALRDRDLRPRGRAGRGQGPPLAPALPARGRRDLRAPDRLRRRRPPTAFETRDYLVVATTRPETMLGDTGVAVHPDDPRYAHLVGKTVRLPLVGRCIPIVADAYADPEKGTGAVKITPAHDFNDWEVGQRAGLAAINVMDTRARIALKDNAAFREGADPADELADLDGLDRYEARELIVTLAEEQGWLDGIDEETHTVPHGDRSKVAIEPFLTDQWYVDAEKLAGPALEAVRDGRTRILPESQEKTYYHWLENIEPWCISRQLWWGHQIPVWYGDYVDAKGEALHGQAPARGRTRRLPGARPLAPRLLRRRRGRRPRGCRGTGTARAIGRRVIVRFEGEPEDEAGDFAEEPGTDLRHPAPRSRRPRHLVLLRHLADRHPRLARGHAGTGTLLPDLRPRHRLRHPLLLGRPDDDDAARAHRRGAVPRRLHPPARPRREGQEDVEVARQHPRPARADRRVRRRRRALHPDRDGGDGPRHQALAATASPATATSAPSSGTPPASPR